MKVSSNDSTPNPRKRTFEKAMLAKDIISAVPADDYSLMKQEYQHYERISKIGQGTFGEVFKSRAKNTGELVAMKKILMESEKEGFPITALREINMLKRLRHRNVTELVDICSTSGKQEKGRVSFYLVFYFCDHDLAGILKSPPGKKMSPTVIKTMLHHLFEGLAYIHSCKVLHRDMKTANILISKDGILKLADFGLARLMINTGDPDGKCYTNRVVTMWYRPPELILGERSYSEEIDVWGAGCIMAEFWTKIPILQGATEQNQLELIVKLCGSIDSTSMKRCESLPLYKNFNGLLSHPRSLANKLGNVIKDDLTAINLIDRLLALEPSNRLTAKQALEHEYFRTPPYAEENVEGFVKTLTASFFEYTVNANNHPPGNNQKPKQFSGANNQRRTMGPTRIPGQQVYDRVY